MLEDAGQLSRDNRGLMRDNASVLPGPRQRDHRDEVVGTRGTTSRLIPTDTSR
jgi:hypothetical protein